MACELVAPGHRSWLAADWLHGQFETDDHPTAGRADERAGVAVAAAARHVDRKEHQAGSALITLARTSTHVSAPLADHEAGDGGGCLPVVQNVPAPGTRPPHPGTDDPFSGDNHLTLKITGFQHAEGLLAP